MGEKRNACRSVVQRSEGRRTFGRSRVRCYDILLNFKGMRWKNKNIKWIYLAVEKEEWWADVKTVMNQWN